jgi:hypothetical protein
MRDFLIAAQSRLRFARYSLEVAGDPAPTRIPATLTAMSRWTVFALALIGLVGVATAAPDFTGSYKIDPSKSSFGEMPPPDKFERKVTHNDPALQYATQYSFQGREINSELKYTTDGKQTTNNVAGINVKGSAKWDGDALVIESARATPNGEIKMIERWNSMDGGKAIQVDAKMVGTQGEIAFKIYLAKQ